jgi:hypothetical protein
MSFRDHASNIMGNLIASGIYSAAILIAIKFWPRIVTKFAELRAAAAVVPALLIGRLRAALFRRRARVGQLTGISMGTSQSYGAMIDATPEPLPPGTASAIVMAMQPLPQPASISPGSLVLTMDPNVRLQPAFVNNSIMMQWDAAARQQHNAAVFAMQSTMPRFNPATL